MKEAIEIINKAIVEECKESKYKLAISLLYGIDMKQNTSVGISYLEELAKAKDINSMIILGNTYYTQGFSEDITQDYEKSFGWFRKAAVLGNNVALKRLEEDSEKSFKEAQNSLGVMYENGQVFEQDYEIHHQNSQTYFQLKLTYFFYLIQFWD